MALEIARRESGFDPFAHNDNYLRGGGDDSYGLMQINMKDELGERRRQKYGITNGALYEPATNMRIAKEIWKENGNSFGGRAGWSTSAAAARTITGGDDDDAEAIGAAIKAKIQQAIDDGKLPDDDPMEYALLVVNDVRGTNGRPGSTEVISAAGLTPSEVEFLRTGTSGGVGDLSPIGGPDLSGLDPLGAIQAVASKLLDPTFWKRIGIGALGAAVILIAILFWNKDTVATIASKGTINDV